MCDKCSCRNSTHTHIYTYPLINSSEGSHWQNAFKSVSLIQLLRWQIDWKLRGLLQKMNQWTTKMLARLLRLGRYLLTCTVLPWYSFAQEIGMERSRFQQENSLFLWPYVINLKKLVNADYRKIIAIWQTHKPTQNGFVFNSAPNGMTIAMVRFCWRMIQEVGLNIWMQ